MDYSINQSGIITRTADGACIPVAPGNMDYEAYHLWVETGNIATMDGVPSHDEVIRSATRTALRQQWDSLPAWINGPYRPLFDAANRLLDEGLDDAAFEMIDAVEPTAKIANDPEKSATFAAVKTQFAAAIQSLKS